jgi:hypothetical protein
LTVTVTDLRYYRYPRAPWRSYGRDRKTGRDLKHLPRWCRVKIVGRKAAWRDTKAEPVDSPGEFIDVKLVKCCLCDRCYAVNRDAWAGLQAGLVRNRMLCCRACERKRFTEMQRQRRQRKRQLRLHSRCVHCGEPIKAKRVTKKYCSVACRVAVLRRLRRSEK